MNNNEKRSFSQILRLYIFIVGLVVCFSIAVITLINYQIVDVDKYVKLAEAGNQIKQVVPAGRGEIVDRYGKKLATNSLELSLVINKEFPIPASSDDKDTVNQKNKEGNDILLKVIKILDENGVDWSEGMCITRSAPCQFKSDKNNEANKLKTALSQQKYATAEDSIALLIEKFNIQGYNEQQTRDIAIIRGMMLIKDFSYSGIFTLVEKIDPTFAGKITEMKNVDVTKYAPELVEAFDKAIEDADTILNDLDNITIPKMKDVISKMEEAYNNLKVDKTELETLVNTAKNIDTSLYTNDSVTNLLNTINDSVNVLEDDETGYRDVIEQIEKLNNSIDNLVKIEDKKDDEGKEQTSNLDDSNKNTVSDQSKSDLISIINNPHTGDIILITLGIFIINSTIP